MKKPRKHPNGFYWSPPDAEWMYKAYVTLDLSAREIADRLGLSKTTVLIWVELYGIPIRSKNGRKSNKPSNAGISQSRKISRTKLEMSNIPYECAECETTESKLDCHHRDGNPLNRDLDNLEWLCRSCHLLLHRRGLV